MQNPCCDTKTLHEKESCVLKLTREIQMVCEEYSTELQLFTSIRVRMESEIHLANNNNTMLQRFPSVDLSSSSYLPTLLQVVCEHGISRAVVQ